MRLQNDTMLARFEDCVKVHYEALARETRFTSAVNSTGTMVMYVYNIAGLL
jgi:hypothetical protein